MSFISKPEHSMSRNHVELFKFIQISNHISPTEFLIHSADMRSLKEH